MIPLKKQQELCDALGWAYRLDGPGDLFVEYGNTIVENFYWYGLTEPYILHLAEQKIIRRGLFEHYVDHLMKQSKVVTSPNYEDCFDWAVEALTMSNEQRADAIIAAVKSGKRA